MKPLALPKKAMILGLAMSFTSGVSPANAQYSSLIGIGTNVLRHAARHAARSSSDSSSNSNSGAYSGNPSVDTSSAGSSPSYGGGNPGDITGTGYYKGQTYSGTSYPANNRHSGSYLNGPSAFSGSYSGGPAVPPSDSSAAANYAAATTSTSSDSANTSSAAANGAAAHASSTAANASGTIPPFSGGGGGGTGSAYNASGSANAFPPSNAFQGGGSSDRFAGGNPGIGYPRIYPSSYPTAYPGTALNLQTGVYQPGAYQPGVYQALPGPQSGVQPVSYAPNTYMPAAPPPSYTNSTNPPPTIYRGRHADRHSVRRINQEVKTHNEAIDLYNKGVEHLNADRYQQAIECFNSALKIDPALDDARHALGIAYNETQDYEQALSECRMAIQQNSSNADFYYTAGDAARHLRDFKSAHKYYAKFLAMGGSGDRADEARKTIDILDHNFFHQADGDYLSDATKEGMQRWLPSSMPLKVYIDQNASVTGYRPAFAATLKESFKDWEDSCQGKISFVFVDKPEQANIKCAWTSEKTKMGSLEELGLTHRMAIPENGQIISATIDLYSLFDKKCADDQMIRTAKAVDLHEIGHALGLDHSQQTYDIMYYCSMPDGLEFPLSDRDKRTMVALYSEAAKNNVATTGDGSKELTASALKVRHNK